MAAPPPTPETDDLAARLRRRIRDHGPLAFSAFTDAALYDPVGGFYARGGRAGRRGDFLTSPEVGPLYGEVWAGALDRCWEDLGRPDPFVVLEGGAGPGTLARSVVRAEPRCAPALTYVAVERSVAQRGLHPEHQPAWVGEATGSALDDLVLAPRRGGGPVVVSAADLPSVPVAGVVVANELLDNLPFDVVARTRTGGVAELVVDVAPDGTFVPRPAPVDGAAADDDVALVEVPAEVWVPRQRSAAEWVHRARRSLRQGVVVVIDYAVTDPELAERPAMGWLRTYRGQERGDHPLDGPGTQDITTDVAVDQLCRAVPGAQRTTQAEFLRRHGIDDLVEEGRRIWRDRAHLGDLAAVRARSRIREAEALLDPDGLGAFAVLIWEVGIGPPGRRHRRRPRRAG